MEDLESSTKKNSVKIFSQFLKFSVFRAQFSGSHFGNSQFRSEIKKKTVVSYQNESARFIEMRAAFLVSHSQ